MLDACSSRQVLGEAQRKAAIATTLEMVERIRQEVRNVGFRRNPAMRELLTKMLVRDLDGGTPSLRRSQVLSAARCDSIGSRPLPLLVCVRRPRVDAKACQLAHPPDWRFADPRRRA